MVELKAEPQKLTAYLSGEIDHHRAKELREQIDLAGRARLMEEYGGVLEIHNPSPQIRKVLRISGADRLAVLRNTKQTGSGKEQEHEYAQ